MSPINKQSNAPGFRNRYSENNGTLRNFDRIRESLKSHFGTLRVFEDTIESNGLPTEYMNSITDNEFLGNFIGANVTGNNPSTIHNYHHTISRR